MQSSSNFQKSDAVEDAMLENCKPMANQIGGHTAKKSDFDKTVLKPVQPPPKGSRELKFYKKIRSTEDQVLLGLKKFVPKFLGEVKSNKVSFIKLEDLTLHFKQPCITDIKMGARTWDDEAPKDKILRECSKYPPRVETGFQLCGYKCYKFQSDKILSRSKEFCRSLSAEDLTYKGLNEYFNGIDSNGVHFNFVAAEAILGQLNEVLKWFNSQRVYKFYASSLLLIYEGDLNEYDNLSHANISKCKMIDFTHVWPSNGEYDENYLHGLKSLISRIKLLIDYHKSKSK